MHILLLLSYAIVLIITLQTHFESYVFNFCISSYNSNQIIRIIRFIPNPETRTRFHVFTIPGLSVLSRVETWLSLSAVFQNT